MIWKDQQNTTLKNDEEKVYFTNIINEVNFQRRGKKVIFAFPFLSAFSQVNDCSRLRNLPFYESFQTNNPS